jgi:tetratricopeptide (TPR) repeat protein
LPVPPSAPPTSPEAEVLRLGPRLLTPGDRIGRYHFLGKVAAGGMAHVVRVTDEGGREVALKVLKSSRRGTGLSRFRREFRALSRLRHDNIIRVDDYGDIEGHPFFAMEYVEGRNLHQAIRSWKGLPPSERWRRCEDVLVDLSRALAYIHRRGLVHRDLKPSNVLVDPHGRCKLTDFGIVKELEPGADPFVSQTLVGTWAYASPEQLSGAPIDHRSDLYSMGVILYAMLTGRRPFVAKDLAGWLHCHRDQSPRPPRELMVGVPRHLEEVCLRLLRKAPRDRFQSAKDVLLRLQVTDPGPGDGAATDETAWEPPLVGRSFEADLLRESVSALTRRQGGVVFIEGPVGFGRSRLMRLALQHARRIGIAVHSTALNPQDGAYGGLLRIAEDLGRELGAGVPPALAHARRAFASPKGRMGGDLRYQLYDAIRSVLAQLMDEGPVVLAIDELHHAPTPMVGLIGYLVRTLVAREQLPLLLVGTVRSDLPAPTLSALRDGRELGLMPVRLELGPLGEDAVLVMVDAALEGQADPVPLARRITEQSGGVPLLVAEAVRQLREQPRGRDGELDPEDDLTEVIPADIRIPPGVRQLVARQLAQVSGAGRRLLSLELLATHGRELELDILLDAAPEDADEDDVLDEIDALAEAGLVVQRTVGVAELLHLAHPRTGEVVYRDLPQGRRVQLHAALAGALVARHADSPVVAEAIGEHYRLADQPALAWRHLVRAAVGLERRSLLGEAEAVVERARGLAAEARSSLPPEVFEDGRRDMLRVRSAVLVNRGRWPDARQALIMLRGSALRAGNDALADHAGLELGHVLVRLGLEDEGRAMTEAVLAGARSRRDRGVTIDALHRLASLSWDAGDLDACEALSNQALVSAVGPLHRARRAKLLTSRSAVQASRGQLASAATGLGEAAEIHDELGNKTQGTITWGNLAELRCWEGRYGAALDAVERSLSLSRAVLFRVGEAFSLLVRGHVLLELGRLGAAEDDLRASLDILQDLGVTGDAVAVRFTHGRLLLERGRVDDARASLGRGIMDAQNQDPESYAPALKACLARAFALQGEAERGRSLVDEVARVLPALPVPRRTQTLLELAEATVLMGDLDGARRFASQAVDCARRGSLRPWALRAWMLLAEVQDPPEDAASRQSAGAVAQAILGDLPQELAQEWRGRPGIEGVLLLQEL